MLNQLGSGNRGIWGEEKEHLFTHTKITIHEFELVNKSLVRAQESLGGEQYY